MKWIGTQTIYDSIRLSGKAKGIQIGGAGTGTLNLTGRNITLYDATNDGSPTISLGSSATNRLEIQSVYASGGQGLSSAKLATYTSESGANDGNFTFEVDEVAQFYIIDTGIKIPASKSLQIGTDNTILSDSSGTTTLSNIDALDSTTESTIESAIDTLANLTSITLDSVNITSMQSSGESFADNDTSLMTSAAIDDRINAAVTGDITGVQFTTDDENVASDTSGSADFGLQGGAGIDTSSSGATITITGETASDTNAGIVELATTAETTTGTDTGRAVTPDGLKDGYQGSANVTTLGTIGTGTWQGTAVASAYLDADTMHYSAQRQLTSHNYKADQDTTETYISLADADSEGTATTNIDLPFTAPVAGKLLKIFLRSNKNLNSHTLTLRLRTISSGANFASTPAVIGTQSGAGCQNSTMTTYDFTTGLDSGTNAIAAGDAVFLTLQSDTDFGSNVLYYVTCLWEWDLS